MLEPGKWLTVFSIRAWKNGSVWVRAGTAHLLPDGTMRLSLDVLPLDGLLHVREAGDRALPLGEGH
jgi:hypothetical protein